MFNQIKLTCIRCLENARDSPTNRRARWLLLRNLNYYADLFQPSPYPSGSWDYLLNKSDANGVGNTSFAPCKLDIAIVGAGIGGLSAAIALRRTGHNVTVYEGANALAEVRTGLQTRS